MINNTQDREVIEQENSIVKRYDLTNYLIEQYNFVDYLEIGVAFGKCVRNVKVKNKDAVDPVVEVNVRCPEINYEMTSNEFFALEKIQNKKYDVIFIDGLHETTQVDIDIQNPQYISKMPRLVKFYKSCGYDIGGINPDDGNLMLFKKIYNGEGCECCSHNQKVMSEKKKFRPQMREGECEGCEALCEECENLHIVEEEEEEEEEYDGEDYEEFLKMKAEKLGMTVEEYVEAEHKMNQQSHLSIEGKTNEDYEKEYDESRKAEAEKYNMTVEELEEAEEDYRQVLEEARYDN